MTAGKHSNLTCPHGYLTSGRHPPRFNIMTTRPAVNCHRAFRRGSRMMIINLAEFEISADRVYAFFTWD